MNEIVTAALSTLSSEPVAGRELARTPQRRIRWYETGSGEHTVVLVAGSGETALDWAPLLPRLATDYRVVALDRAGLGSSDAMPRLSLDAQIADLAAVLDEVGPAIVLGHSWGGLLTQFTAMARPRSVRAMVLLDPSHEEVLAAIPRALHYTAAAVFACLPVLQTVGLFRPMATMQARRLADACEPGPDRQPLIAAYLASYATRSQVRTIHAEHMLADRCIGRLRLLRAESRLPDVPLRVLTPNGATSRLKRLSVHKDTEVAASVPRGRHVLVAGTGHYVHHDRPDAVLAAVDQVREVLDQNL